MLADLYGLESDMNNKNGFKDSRAGLETHIKQSKHPAETNVALRQTFDALCIVLPDAMAIPDVSVAITTSAIVGGIDSRADLIRAGAELGKTKGRLLLSVMMTLAGKKGLAEKIEDIEREIIRAALETNESKGGAAKALGIPQSTLSTKLRRFGLRE